MNKLKKNDIMFSLSLKRKIFDDIQNSTYIENLNSTINSTLISYNSVDSSNYNQFVDLFIIILLCFIGSIIFGGLIYYVKIIRRKNYLKSRHIRSLKYIDRSSTLNFKDQFSNNQIKFNLKVSGLKKSNTITEINKVEDLFEKKKLEIKSRSSFKFKNDHNNDNINYKLNEAFQFKKDIIFLNKKLDNINNKTTNLNELESTIDINYKDKKNLVKNKPFEIFDLRNNYNIVKINKKFKNKKNQIKDLLNKDNEAILKSYNTKGLNDLNKITEASEDNKKENFYEFLDYKNNININNKNLTENFTINKKFSEDKKFEAEEIESNLLNVQSFKSKSVSVSEFEEKVLVISENYLRNKKMKNSLNDKDDGKENHKKLNASIYNLGDNLCTNKIMKNNFV